MTFPSRLLRGLRKADWLIDGPRGTKRISQQAFEHEESTAKTRADNRCETSINWDDDVGVLEFTRRQTNSQYGVAAISTSALEELEQSSEVAGTLAHERRQADGNPYHGNLLFAADCPKKFLRLVHNALALRAGEPVAAPRG